MTDGLAAGRRTEEIEITPEMIEAAADILRGSDSEDRPLAVAEDMHFAALAVSSVRPVERRPLEYPPA